MLHTIERVCSIDMYSKTPNSEYQKRYHVFARKPTVATTSKKIIALKHGIIITRISKIATWILYFDFSNFFCANKTKCLTCG